MSLLFAGLGQNLLAKKLMTGCVGNPAFKCFTQSLFGEDDTFTTYDNIFQRLSVLKEQQKCLDICFNFLYSVTITKLMWLCFRIVRAFLIEEQKIVVRVLKAQEASKK